MLFLLYLYLIVNVRPACSLSGGGTVVRETLKSWSCNARPVEDLSDLELSYAPPLGIPSDAVQVPACGRLAEQSQERAGTVARGASASATSWSGSGRSR
jgi:hypothetical protein